ncbi:MFS transporter [Amycolatopsis sp. NPDC058340]|uniref:MFS transporter n=1 Tax=Amycolatopsis sp. NPDC058340 TaxID=3346453 RepID=UPI0036695A8F
MVQRTASGEERTTVGRFDPFRERNFRLFFGGYAASNIGTAMATVALSFAVLDSTGSLTDLSLVLAARIVPLVLFLLGGGLLGDRLSRRWVMIISDCVRAVSQGLVATLFLLGHPPLWTIVTLAAIGGAGEAFFKPSFDGLIPEMVSARRLPEANALLGLTQSVAMVGGPSIAGVLVAMTSPAVALMVDASSYLLSIVSLLCLRINDAPPGPRSSLFGELRDGWKVFGSRPWLWTVTLQFTMFNLVVWAPYLVLGPASAHALYGGAGAWGTVLAVYGAGSILGGLLLLGRRPKRPLVVTTTITFLWAAPSAALAFEMPLVVVCAGALAAGVANAVFNGLWLTTVQRHVPSEALSRVMSYVSFGAYAVGPIGLALAGPLAEATSIPAVLAVGVGWQLIATSIVLALPAIRGLTATEDASPASGTEIADGGA